MSSRLQDHFVVLCQKLNVDRVLPILRQQKMVTMDEFEMLTNPTLSTRQKREKLLIILPRKGKHHFEKFGECLVWSGQEQLAQTIGVDISKVNPRPANVPPPSTQPDLQESQQQAMLEVLRRIAQGAPLSDGQSGPLSLPHVPHSHHIPAPLHSLPPGFYGGYPTPAVAPPTMYPPQTMLPATQTMPASTQTMPASTHTMQQNTQTMPLNPYQTQTVVQNTYPVQDQFYPAQPRPAQTTVVQPQPPIRRVRHPNHPAKVFILYCKDPSVCDSVLDMADLLNKCGGGIMCDFDGYDNHSHETNYSLWTENMIGNSDYVLLVCTPPLSAHLSNPSHTLVEMTRGKFYADAIVNYISPVKFIPIFLNSNYQKALVPTSLHATAHFEVYMSDLMEDMGDTGGMDEERFGEKLAELLQERKYEGIRSLLQLLRGDEVNPRPAPPLQPVRIPPSQEFVAEGDLLKIAERLPRDWQHLGIKLGVEYSTLETLRTKHLYDTRSATMEMFGVWQQMKGRAATRKGLKQALMDLGYGRVASEVFGRE